MLPDAVRIIIELDAEVLFHRSASTGPDRVFLDFSPARAAPPLQDQTLRFNSDSDVVRQVRLGRHENRTTRVVLDAGGVGTLQRVRALQPVPARDRLRARESA